MKSEGVLWLLAFVLVFYSMPLWKVGRELSPAHSGAFGFLIAPFLDLVALFLVLLGVRLRRRRVQQLGRD